MTYHTILCRGSCVRKSPDEARKIYCISQKIICSCLIYKDSLYFTFHGLVFVALSLYVIHIYDIFIIGVNVCKAIIYRTVIESVIGDIK
jgi:hypothetical protein